MGYTVSKVNFLQMVAHISLNVIYTYLLALFYDKSLSNSLILICDHDSYMLNNSYRISSSIIQVTCISLPAFQRRILIYLKRLKLFYEIKLLIKISTYCVIVWMLFVSV